MDFQSLTRRELQALCKKNKIPANMTNLAMADALSALTDVEGIEDIGKSLPDTPIACRKTSSRKPTKPQSEQNKNEPASALPQTETGRAPRRIIKEEDEESKEPKVATEKIPLSEMPKTPAARTGRKRVTGTSVSRKIDTQIKEKEIPVIPRAYSTRRSTRLQQSEPKISESAPKSSGRRNEAVKIEMLSEEETDTLEKESNSEVIDEVQKNEGATTVKVLSANEYDMVNEDVSSEKTGDSVFTEECTAEQSIVDQAVKSEEFMEECTVEQSIVDQAVKSEEFSANVISAEVPSTDIAHVKDECKEEFTVEGSNGDQDANSEEYSANVISAEVSSTDIAHVSVECKEEINVEGSNGDQNITPEEFSTTVIPAEDSDMNIAAHASPLVEKAPLARYHIANVISAEVPSTDIAHVKDECKEEFTVEGSNGDQDANSEEYSANVISAEVSSTDIVHVSVECKEEINVEGSNGDQDITPEEFSTTVIPAEDSDMNIAAHASPLVEKAPILEDSISMKDVDQATENNEEDKKLIVEEELCDVKVTVVEGIVLDVSSMEEITQILEDSNGECLMNSLPSAVQVQVQDQANEINEDEFYEVKVIEVEPEVLDCESLKNSLEEVMNNLDEQQEQENVNVSLPSKVSSDIHNESENSVADEGLENQMVKLENSDTVATYESEDLELDITAILDESENSVADDGLEYQMVNVKNSDTVADVDAEKLQMASVATYESEDLELDTTAILDDEVQWSSDSEVSDSEVVEEVSDIVENISFSPSATDIALNKILNTVLTPTKSTGAENHVVVVEVSDVMENISFSPLATDLALNRIPNTVLTPTKSTGTENQIQGTPLRSSTKKKAQTTPIIKVLEEDNERDKISLRSNSKVLTVVAEEKENNETNKGENTAQRSLRKKSLRKLKKMMKQCTITDDKNTITTTTENNKVTVVKLEKKRLALQPLNNNCLVEENDN